MTGGQHLLKAAVYFTAALVLLVALLGGGSPVLITTGLGLLGLPSLMRGLPRKQPQRPELSPTLGKDCVHARALHAVKSCSCPPQGVGVRWNPKLAGGGNWHCEHGYVGDAIVSMCHTCGKDIIDAYEEVFGLPEFVGKAEAQMLGALNKDFMDKKLSLEQYTDCVDNVAWVAWAADHRPTRPGGPTCTICVPERNPLRGRRPKRAAERFAQTAQDAALVEARKQVETLKDALANVEERQAVLGYPTTGHQQGHELAVLRRRLRRAYEDAEAAASAALGRGVSFRPYKACWPGCCTDTLTTDGGKATVVSYCDGSHLRDRPAPDTLTTTF